MHQYNSAERLLETNRVWYESKHEDYSVDLVYFLIQLR